MSEATARREETESRLLHLARQGPDGGPPWLLRLRQTGRSLVEKIGFPTSRDEDWKHTSVGPILRTPFGRASHDPCEISVPEILALPLGDLGCPRLVFVNGLFAPDLSDTTELPEAVRVESLASILAESPESVEKELGRIVNAGVMPFAALNAACFEDGAVVSVPPGMILETPVHLLYVSTGSGEPVAAHPRNLVLLGEGSEATLVESYLNRDAEVYLNNAVTEIALGRNAGLDHYRVQWESAKAFHVGAVQTRQARDSRYRSFHGSLGASLARNDVGCRLEGEAAESSLHGLYLASASEHIDNHTAIDHASPHCPSEEVYKGILTDDAVAVFNGRVIVREGAQKTNAQQSNRNLLLSDDALVHTRPQLEIYADDVKCTHGATIGHLDEDALFYVRSRGIGEHEARALLTYGFARDVLEAVRFDPLRVQLECELIRRVSEGLEIETQS